ncbi:MAG TPA: glycosyltransferase family 2 protein [Prolixibacteraceae bacterium]|nr:glycosyltransferase family 2 protein [Prolixibacteraceae bacterium]
MKTAIVILNWNGIEQLQKYLHDVVARSKGNDNRVIVADNGSTDHSLSYIEANFPTVECIKLDHNYGFAGGYNRALEHVEADVYCLLNSDVRVSDDWLSDALGTLSRDEDIVAVQPKILSDRDQARFEHAGAAGGFIDHYGYPFCRGRIMDVIENDEGQYDNSIDIFWASGACLFIKSKAFWDAGGFDADFFAHMEEIDLCWRIKNQGKRIVYCPGSVVYHWGGATLDYENPRKLFLNFRNSLWTLYKNYTGLFLGFMMFRRMMIDTSAILKYLVSFNPKNAMAVITAHVAFYKSMPQIRHKRKALREKVVIRKHNEMLQGSVVLDFFLGRKRTFSNLKKFREKINSRG